LGEIYAQENGLDENVFPWPNVKAFKENFKSLPQIIVHYLFDPRPTSPQIDTKPDPSFLPTGPTGDDTVYFVFQLYVCMLIYKHGSHLWVFKYSIYITPSKISFIINNVSRTRILAQPGTCPTLYNMRLTTSEISP